jgi:large subunit ribosomal protein L21
MFAVIRSGGKQYKVAQNEVIVVERMAGNSGASIDLGDVLIVGDGTKTTVGKPTVEGAQVLATLVEHSRADKIKVFKRKRRKGYRRTAGHRQLTTVLRISEISAPGMKAAKAAAKPAAKAAAKPEAEAKAADVNKAAANPAAKAADDNKAAAKPEAKADAKPAAKKADAKPAAKPKGAAKPAAKKAEAKKDKD